MNLFVTGGAGYIGSHAVKVLLDAGHRVTVVDSLVHGHAAAVDSRATFLSFSTADADRLSRVLREFRCEAVLHFAADIEVGESVVDPGKYYSNNFARSLGLLEAMRDAEVKKIVFSSTAAVYGDPSSAPIPESAPTAPINPYGRSKRMTEMAIEDFSRAHGLGYAILRYFNVAGAAPDGSIGEDHEPESHLIPRVLAAAMDPSAEICIFGTDYSTPDGTCVRDYVHVMDLARAHLLALESIVPGCGEIYNLGSETGFSVREVIETCRRVTGQSIRIREEGRRSGDAAVLVASSEKIRRELGWDPRGAALDRMIEDAWRWKVKNPFGYRTPTKDSLAESGGNLALGQVLP